MRYWLLLAGHVGFPVREIDGRQPASNPGPESLNRLLRISGAAYTFEPAQNLGR